MTRRITGSPQTTQSRPAYILPFGHLSTKSSVYSPVSMSRMSQDLVYNHMKSHYLRISSAKACVDTSAPKSMKLTIKEKDRKRKETLHVANTSRASSRSSSRQSHYLTEASNPRKSPRSPSGQSQRRSSVNSTRKLNETFQENDDTKQTRFNGRLKEPLNHKESLRANNQPVGHNTSIDKHNYKSFEGCRSLENTSTIGTNHNAKASETDSATNVNSFRGSYNSTRNTNHIDEYNYKRYERTGLRREKVHEQDMEYSTGRLNNHNTRFSEIKDSSNFCSSLQQDKWDDERNTTLQNDFEEIRTAERLQTSTPRNERENEYLNLNLSTMMFSYKSPPIQRKPRRKKPQELIWTEEQKYLQFISDVTSDVLARGICSNRVITKVFESHIEKRKDELDEEKMRDMIQQLKEDLGVTDA